MKLENTHRKELLLYHWVRIIRELYPHIRTENPYQAELEALTEYLNLDQKLLFNDVLHSITLINAHSRRNETKQLISTHADFMNALQMVTPIESQLTIQSIEAHEKLSSIFKENPFTYLDACTRLRVSKTSFRRIMKPLILRGLLTKLSETREKKALFQIQTIKVDHQEPELDPFETMQGDWKDFQGFVEF